MQNIWIFNHYAISMFDSRSGRHYSLAKYLDKSKFKVTIFCANTFHGTNRSFDINGEYAIEELDGIVFVIMQCPNYATNGLDRIKNMYIYYKKILKIYSKFDRPDLIIGSQVHPLACLASIKISKKVNCKCITEYRDLWPLSIVEYSRFSDRNPMIKALYILEKYLYTNSDAIIFTMQGGVEYLKERPYSSRINFENVYHINNGVDLDVFNYNKKNYILDDELLEDRRFKIIFTGSLREVNCVEEIMQSLSLLKFDFIALFYGWCDDIEKFDKAKEKYGISNKAFYRGSVKKEYIPYVLSKSNLNIIYWKSENISKRGISANKLFDYFAASKPIISNNIKAYDLVETNGCGFSYSITSIKDYAEAIYKVDCLSIEEYQDISENCMSLAKQFDYKKLAQKLELLILKTLGDE